MGDAVVAPPPLEIISLCHFEYGTLHTTTNKVISLEVSVIQCAQLFCFTREHGRHESIGIYRRQCYRV